MKPSAAMHPDPFGRFFVDVRGAGEEFCGCLPVRQGCSDPSVLEILEFRPRGRLLPPDVLRTVRKAVRKELVKELSKPPARPRLSMQRGVVGHVRLRLGARSSCLG